MTDDPNIASPQADSAPQGAEGGSVQRQTDALPETADEAVVAHEAPAEKPAKAPASAAPRSQQPAVAKAAAEEPKSEKMDWYILKVQSKP